VGLFSRVCSNRTPGRIYRWNQEKACQTLENKPTSPEYYRCRLEKNRCDRILATPLSSHDILWFIGPPRHVLCRVIAHKRVGRLKQNPMGHMVRSILISVTRVVISRMNSILVIYTQYYFQHACKARVLKGEAALICTSQIYRTGKAVERSIKCVSKRPNAEMMIM
jgi:hypothetical protein